MSGDYDKAGIEGFDQTALGDRNLTIRFSATEYDLLNRSGWFAPAIARVFGGYRSLRSFRFRGEPGALVMDYFSVTLSKLPEER